MLGKYSKESNWTYQKVLCLPGQPAHRASVFCGTFLSPDLSLSKLEGSSSTQWYRLCFNGNWDHHLYRGWFMPLSFSNREWGCSLDVYLLLRAVNLSQIPQYSHNEVLIILVSESRGDSLVQPVFYLPTTSHAILVFKRFCETSICCIIVLMIMQKLNLAISEFRI